MENECEILAKIDSVLARTLIIDLGYTQAKVAKLFYTTPPAISQYMSGVRGGNINFNDEVNNAIRNLADSLNVKSVFSKHDLRKHRYEILLLHFKDQDEQETQT